MVRILVVAALAPSCGGPPPPPAAVLHRGVPACEGTLSDAHPDPIATLACARTLLAAGDYDGADRLARNTQERYPYSRRANEAMLLRVDVLIARGDDRAAAIAIDRWLHDHPRPVGSSIDSLIPEFQRRHGQVRARTGS